MALSYNNLWHRLIDCGMSKTELRRATGMSSVTLAKLSKCEPVATTTLEKICDVLKCDIGDIVNHLPDPKSQDDEGGVQ